MCFGSTALTNDIGFLGSNLHSLCNSLCDIITTTRSLLAAAYTRSNQPRLHGQHLCRLLVFIDPLKVVTVAHLSLHCNHERSPGAPIPDERSTLVTLLVLASCFLMVLRTSDRPCLTLYYSKKVWETRQTPSEFSCAFGWGVGWCFQLGWNLKKLKKYGIFFQMYFDISVCDLLIHCSRGVCCILDRKTSHPFSRRLLTVHCPPGPFRLCHTSALTYSLLRINVFTCSF